MRVKLKHRRLAKELASRPISLNRWAQRLGLSSGHLSDLVNGKRPYPAPATREKLLDSLDLPFEELFEVEHRSPSRRRSSRPQTPWRRPRGFSDASRDRPRRRIEGGTTDVLALTADIRYALRILKRSPGFALTAILVLALGIGSNTALFSLVDSILWKPFPYREGESLVVVGSTRESFGRDLDSLSLPDFRDIRRESDLLDELAIWDWEPYNLTGDAEPMQVGGSRVSAGFFDVLGVPPLAGRTFAEEDDDPAAEPVVLLSEGLWRGTFGSDPDVVGRSVLINSHPTTVIGVMPEEATYPDRTVLWVPLRLDDESAPRGSRFLGSIGRLKEGVEVPALDAELGAIAARLEERYPGTNEGLGFAALTLRESLTGDMRILSLALLGVVTFVLLIVCANVANLLLSRSLGREREVAIRRALGAGRARLAQGLLSESLLLASVGGVVGFFFGWLLLGRFLILRLVDVEIPPWIQTEMDLRVVVYTLAVTLFATVLCGLFPLFQTRRGDLARALHQGGRLQIGSPRGGRLRAALVVAEVSLSLVLLVGAGLMIQSVLGITAVDPGFRAEGALRVGLDLLTELDAGPEERAALFHRHLDRLAALPGVEAVGAINLFPLDRRSSRVTVSLPGQSVEESRRNPAAQVGHATAGYFRAMGIPLLRGEPFRETASTPEREAVVSESLARLLWPEAEAVGQRLKFGDADSGSEWLTVRGVVGDITHHGLDREPTAHLYTPYERLAPARMSIVLRSSGDLGALAKAVRAAVREIDPHQPLHDVVTVEELVELSLWQWRFFTTLFWAFAAVATALALIGIYGVMSGVTTQRTKEVGLRIALGADQGQVLGMILRQGSRLIGFGLLIGLPLALGLGRVLSGVLYGVDPVEPATLFGIVLLLGAVSLGAVLLPARRAAAVDPATSLRAE